MDRGNPQMKGDVFKKFFIGISSIQCYLLKMMWFIRGVDEGGGGVQSPGLSYSHSSHRFPYASLFFASFHVSLQTFVNSLVNIFFSPSSKVFLFYYSPNSPFEYFTNNANLEIANDICVIFKLQYSLMGSFDYINNFEEYSQ